MVEITLRNPDRKRWMTGFGIINRCLATVCNSEDNRDAPVHFFMSPPYSFQDVDTSKFNVGLTMCERDDLQKRQWHGQGFIPLCNQMDLILVPGPWQKQIFTRNGVTCPIEVVTLGHDHERWEAPIRETSNRHCLIVDRGRDHSGAMLEAQKYFEQVTYLDLRTPSQKRLEAMPPEARTRLVEEGKYTHEDLRKAYAEADVFFKWGREGYCFPILQAMSAGCLIITNCHTLPYIRPDKNALTFNSVDALHKCLLRAEADPLTEIKKAGKHTAYAMPWLRAISQVKGAILEHASRSPKCA